MEPLQIILTSLLSIVILFVLAKLMGHKQIGQLDLFDYITGRSDPLPPSLRPSWKTRSSH